jgi:hypothetical protein
MMAAVRGGKGKNKKKKKKSGLARQLIGLMNGILKITTFIIKLFTK